MSTSKQIWTLICDDLSENASDIVLSEEELHYAFHVLRLRQGTKVEVVNGKGLKATATIKEINKKLGILNVENIFKLKRPNTIVNLCLATPKPAVLDEVVACASEMGAAQIHIFKGERSFSRAPIKTEKLKRTSLEAMRISKSSFCSEVFAYNSLVEFYSQYMSINNQSKIVLFCDESHVYDGKVTNSILTLLNKEYSFKVNEIYILIGPESSFDEQERNFIFEKIKPFQISLGKNILRVPNAVISALGTALNFLEEKIIN